jgi:mRNA interferase MazF
MQAAHNPAQRADIFPDRHRVDKVTTVPKSRLGQCIGRLADDDQLRLNRSLLVFLGLAR